MMDANVNNNLVVALDIGTTKVCAVAGRKNEHGRLEIIGHGKVESKGVLRGVVSNIEKTVTAISEAIAAAERMAGRKFEFVHVGIAGQHIKSLQHRGMLTRDNDHTEIGPRDIERLISDMHKLVLPPGDKILHVIPQEYTVDNEQGILDPIGMSGIRLEANFHIITGQISASNNIHRCVERAGLRVANMTLEPIASAASVLSEEEKEAGVALVDIGGGTTDITLFQDGIIRHTAVVPFGGNVITKDIKEGCTVMIQQAEKLKVRFGAALAEEVYDNRIITIPGLKGRPPKEISEKNLARIIQARVEEILDYVVWEIRRSGLERKLIGGIVLTGGGALLNHIDKLAAFHTGFPTRIGIPVEHLAHGYAEQLSSPIYSTAIGLLLKGIRDVESGLVRYRKPEPEKQPELVEETVEEKSAWYEQLFRKTKEWFEAEPDQDF
ncbi:MAG: cell division protein FtsA [Saprospiraceae bacterium]|nr:cell division protein FtsA [Saprospiraceae bacterium]MCB0677242.1 cell division protein FtsA [Saprospiraceae bacterium]MCB0682530.1 cell division protein FtsA [Saprospiraceae bacterium]